MFNAPGFSAIGFAPFTATALSRKWIAFDVTGWWLNKNVKVRVSSVPATPSAESFWDKRLEGLSFDILQKKLSPFVTWKFNSTK